MYSLCLLQKYNKFKFSTLKNQFKVTAEISLRALALRVYSVHSVKCVPAFDDRPGRNSLITRPGDAAARDHVSVYYMVQTSCICRREATCDVIMMLIYIM